MTILMAADDKAKLLVQRAQRGDRAAFDDLVQEFEPRLRRLIDAGREEQIDPRFMVERIIAPPIAPSFELKRRGR